MNRLNHCVFICIHYVIVQKTRYADIVYFHPKPFYGSLQQAEDTRELLIDNGTLSEKSSSVQGVYFMVLCMN